MTGNKVQHLVVCAIYFYSLNHAAWDPPIEHSHTHTHSSLCGLTQMGNATGLKPCSMAALVSHCHRARASSMLRQGIEALTLLVHEARSPSTEKPSDACCHGTRSHSTLYKYKTCASLCFPRILLVAVLPIIAYESHSWQSALPSFKDG